MGKYQSFLDCIKDDAKKREKEKRMNEQTNKFNITYKRCCLLNYTRK